MTFDEKYLQFGKYTKKCPKWLLEKVIAIDKRVIDEEYVKRILRVIAEEFNPTKYMIVTTSNIRESRLITVTDVLKRRLSSCGAKATVIASVFRNLGIPAKLIHGRYVTSSTSKLHAWNEILLEGNKWEAFDIDGKKRKISEYHIREFEVVDWSDIEDNIDEL